MSFFLKYINKIKKRPLLSILVLSAVAIVMYYASRYFLPVSSTRIVLPNEGTADLILIYAPWCGHCKKMMPDYDRVIRDYHGKRINGYTLNILKYNSDVDKDEVKKRNIKGFPSLFFEMNGESKEFNKRKYDDIVEELKNLLK